MKFSDGLEFDLTGSLRLVEAPDGFYVIGEGYLCAVDSEEEGRELIREMEQPYES